MILISDTNTPQRQPRSDKVEQVEMLTDLLSRSAGLYLTDYRGITVAEKADLSRRLRQAGAEYHVVKNTLFLRAFADRSELPDEAMAGPTAIAFALEDPVQPAKVVLDFIREKRKMTVKGGIVEGRFFDPDGVQKLSQTPPKAVLIAQVVGAIQSPLAGLVYALQDVVAGLARTIQAIHDQRAGE